MEYILKDGSYIPVVEEYIKIDGTLVAINKIPESSIPPQPDDPVVPPSPDGQPNWIVQTKPLVIDGKSGVVVENYKFDGVLSNCITIKNSTNIIIRNCWFSNTVTPAESALIAQSAILSGFGGKATADKFRASGGYSANTRHAIFIPQNSSNITVENCYFERVESAFYMISGSGPVVFRNNECKNVQGPFPRGQLVQLNSVTGYGIDVSYNYVVNERDNSFPEDVINFYKVQGLSTNYAKLSNNYIYGHGPSTSGTSFLICDGGVPSKYVIASGNVCIQSNGCGIAGGNFSIIDGNMMYNNGTDRSNVAVAIVNFYTTTGACSGHTIINNNVLWKNKDDVWNPFFASTSRPCSGTVISGNNWYDYSLSQDTPAPVGAGIRSWSGPLTTS